MLLTLLFFIKDEIIIMGKTKQFISAGLAALVMCMGICFIGCAPDPIGQFTDDSGTAITLGTPPENIICLVPAVTELMFALGEGSRLIAVSDYCDYPADGIKDLPRFGFGADLSVEALLRHGCDALFLTKMGHDKDKAELLRKAGVAVVVFEAQKIIDIERHIIVLGDIFNKESVSKKLVSDMRTDLDYVKDALKDKTAVSVFLEISPLEATLYTANNSTFLGEILTMCKVDNIFKSEPTAWAAISEESVIIRNPSVILKMYKDEEYAYVGQLQPISSRPGWSAIAAVKSGKIAEVDSVLYSRATNRLPQIAKSLALLIHGVVI